MLTHGVIDPYPPLQQALQTDIRQFEIREGNNVRLWGNLCCSVAFKKGVEMSVNFTVDGMPKVSHTRMLLLTLFLSLLSSLPTSDIHTTIVRKPQSLRHEISQDLAES